MKNIWNNLEAKRYIKEYAKKKVSEELALRIYTTHLLGNEKKLVLHGGGNTSVKSELKDIFQNNKQVIYVKGSGWDMSNLNELGLPGLFLEPLLETQNLNSFSDHKMVNFLRVNLINSFSRSFLFKKGSSVRAFITFFNPSPAILESPAI